MTALAPEHAPSELAEHLQARLAAAVERHLAVAREWFPHEYVPWSYAAEAADLPEEQARERLPAPVRAAVQLNLLTEDNLPAYHRELHRAFGDDEPWRTWLGRWTAEEGRHAIALRDYLVVTRCVDPVALERDRMATVQAGFRAPEKDTLRTLAYVALQELATRISHRNTGRVSGDPGLERLLARVATDENLHMVLYRDLVAAALEVDPAAMLGALADELAGFTMPGAGQPQFRRRAAAVARAGIYDLRVHREEVVEPLLRFWGVFACAGADEPLERIAAVCEHLDRRVAAAGAR